MSVAAIFSNALSQTNSLPNTSPQRRADFQQIAQAFQSGDANGTQRAMEALTQGLPSPVGTAIQSALSRDLSTLGSSLQSGNLANAQQAYSSFQLDAQTASAAGHVHHHRHHGGSQESTPVSNAGNNSGSSANGSGQPSAVAAQPTTLDLNLRA
jgi:hypothetical protein